MGRMPISYLYSLCLLVFVFVTLYNFYAKKTFEFALKIREAEQVVVERLFKLQRNLTLDKDLLSRSIQDGNSDRLKSVLKKALRGENINMLVIGGSHSAGGKLGLDENSLDGLYYKVFAKWWNNTFGSVTKSFVKEIPLAIGATDSYFFAFCYKTFLAEDEKIDIVLIEISANDKRYQSAKPLEHLTRQVLLYPSSPAVLYINLVSGFGIYPGTSRIQNPHCVNLENFGQTELARHYEITSFSLKEVLCRKENGRWKVVLTNMTGSDGNHIGLKAHAHVATMIVAYITRVFKEAVNEVYNTPLKNVDQVAANIGVNLPKLFLIKRETEALKKLLCWTGKTPDVFQKLHLPDLQITVVQIINFSRCFVVRDQEVNVKRMSEELRTDSQGGWCAWNRSSTLKLKIYVPLIADDNSFRSRSVTILTRHEGGEAIIWLDNEIHKAIQTDSRWLNDQFDTIGTRVKPGYHTITVRTLHNRMFMVAGVFVGAPDFQIK